MSAINYIVGIGNQTWSYGNLIYGSSLPARFIRDLASGTDSVDIVVVGDSNTGSSAADMWGYHNGMQQALWERGMTCYGTPVLPAMTGLTTAGATSATPLVWRGANTMWTGAKDLGGGVFTPLDGNISGGSTPYAAWSPSVTWTRYGSSNSTPPYKESWAYLDGTAQWLSGDGVSIQSNHPLSANGQTLRYRVRYGAFVGSTGYFCPIVRNTANAEITARFAVPTLSVSGGVDSKVSERSWTTSGSTGYQGGWAWVGLGGEQTRGPVAIHSHSIYRPVKGWSVTSHGYQSGETSTQISQKIDAVKGSPLQEHLKELRSRQIAAGGSGRVLVLAHAGVNGTETAAQWVTSMRRLWDAYKSAWSTLGYPTADLAILCWVSHMFSADDTSTGAPTGNMGAMRESAKAMAQSYPDMTVADVKQMMPYNRLLNGMASSGTIQWSFYQKNAAGTEITKAHLSGGPTGVSTWSPNDGYALLCHGIIGGLIAQP